MNAVPSGLVLDHTALLAFGRGHRRRSGRVSRAHGRREPRIFVPAVALAAASAQRAAVGGHIGALPYIEVVELDFSAALSVGAMVAKDVDWPTAHAAQVGRPDLEWPTGRPVFTQNPDAYVGLGADTVKI